MSEQTLTLRIVTPSGLAFEEQVSSVVLRGDLGEFGILAGHVSMVSTIVEGEMRYEGGPGGGGSFIARGGISEVKNDTVTVLTKALESPDGSDTGETTKTGGD